MGEATTGAAAATATAPVQEQEMPAKPPVEEAALAIAAARDAVAQALAEVTSEDADRLARGYELAAGCADHIARALWFLHRAERDKTD